MNLASSIQEVTEEILLKIAETVKRKTGESNLCLAGGVALNSVVMELIERSGVFENMGPASRRRCWRGDRFRPRGLGINILIRVESLN